MSSIMTQKRPDRPSGKGGCRERSFWVPIIGCILIAGLFSAVVADNLEEAGLFANKGRALIKIGDYMEALTAFNTSIVLDPTYAPGWAGYAQTLSLLGRNDEAIMAYDHALTLDPRDALSWQGRAETLYKEGKYQEAVFSFERSGLLNPNQSRAFNGKGDALMNLGNAKEAIPSYKRALVHEPDNNLTWSHLGKAFMATGDYTGALEAFDQAVALSPKDAETWNNRGAALYYLGRFDESLSSYEKAVSLDSRFSVDANATKFPSSGGAPGFIERQHPINAPLIFMPRSAGGTGIPPIMFLINMGVMLVGIAGIILMTLLIGARRFKEKRRKKE